MAYDRYTWVDGEVITAQKLNHIEEGIAEGGDAGYECEETVYFDGNVVVEEHSDGQGHTWTSGEFTTTPPKGLLGLDELNIVLNGEEYTLPKTGGNDNYASFTIYSPQRIGIDVGGNLESCSLSVNVAGTYSLKIATHSIVSVSGCFKMAVNDVIPEERYIYFDISGSDFGGYYTSINPSEIYEMARNGNGYRLVPRAMSDDIELKYAGYDYDKQLTKFIGWKFGYWQETTVRNIDCVLYSIPASGSITKKLITIHEEPDPNA